MYRYLVTQSLLSAWAYTFDCAEGCEADAQEEFLRTLHREKSPATPAMEAGIAFENECYRAAAGLPRKPHSDWEKGIQAIADIIRGAQIQVKLSREIEVMGEKFLVYGVLDALKAGVIYDVKFKVKRFHSLDLAGSYLESAQHPFYFYICPEAYEFRYLVSDGEDIYKEEYRPADCRDIRDIITEFIQSITEMGLLPLYKEKWLAK